MPLNLKIGDLAQGEEQLPSPEFRRKVFPRQGARLRVDEVQHLKELLPRDGLCEVPKGVDRIALPPKLHRIADKDDLHPLVRLPDSLRQFVSVEPVRHANIQKEQVAGEPSFQRLPQILRRGKGLNQNVLVPAHCLPIENLPRDLGQEIPLILAKNDLYHLDLLYSKHELLLLPR